jgi:serine/threonine protein kinase
VVAPPPRRRRDHTPCRRARDMRRSSNPTASLRGSRLSAGLCAGLRASRLRRASAAADGRAPPDLASKAGFRQGFDPLLLLRRAGEGAPRPPPQREQGKGGGKHNAQQTRQRQQSPPPPPPPPPPPRCVVAVKAGKGRLGLGIARGDRYVAELVGDTVVLRDARYAADGEAGWRAAGGAPIAALFCCGGAGAEVFRAKGSAAVRVRRPDDTGKEAVVLRFGAEADAAAWEAALVRAASVRVARVSDFEFISPIGKGASGKVFLVRDRVGGGRYAIKVVGKARVFETRSGFRHAMDERLALEAVCGAGGFTQLKWAFQTRANFYFVMEFCEGGDLYQYLRSMGGRVGEGAVRRIMAEVVVAMEHLHAKGFVYRDLKTENVLLTADGHVRLADFGLSKFLPEDDPLTSTICGTHTFASVEMLAQRHYSKSVDLWAAGIFAFYLLNGRTPFEAQDLDRVIQKLNRRVIRFRASTSPEFVSLVKRLLDWQPATRLGCGPTGWQEVKDHPFFASVDWRAVGQDPVHDPAPSPRQADHFSTPVKRAASDSAAGLPGSPVTPAADAAAAPPPPPPPPPPRMAAAPAVPAADSIGGDELRNFDVGLWRETVSVDDDVDDAAAERYLWPLRSARRPLLDDQYVIGFNFTAPSL